MKDSQLDALTSQLKMYWQYRYDARRDGLVVSGDRAASLEDSFRACSFQSPLH